MTVTLELKPALDARLRELARASGLTVEKYLARLIERSVPALSGHAAIALLDEWGKEDATADRDELAKRRKEWTAFKAAMNEGHSSDRLLFP